MNDDNNGRTVFYYSREERLKRAPQIVRDMNDPMTIRKSGLLRALVATRSLKILLFSIIFFCMITLFLTRFMRPGNVRVLGNSTIAVSVIGAGEESYITVKKTERESRKETVPDAIFAGAVDIAVTMPSEEKLLHIERIFFSTDREEIFRFCVPFRGEKFLILMQAGEAQAQFVVKSD